jgi:hypothetical protein
MCLLVQIATVQDFVFSSSNLVSFMHVLRFEDLKAWSFKFTVLWDATPCTGPFFLLLYEKLSFLVQTVSCGLVTAEARVRCQFMSDSVVGQYGAMTCFSPCTFFLFPFQYYPTDAACSFIRLILRSTLIIAVDRVVERLTSYTSLQSCIPKVEYSGFFKRTRPVSHPASYTMGT